MAIRIIDESSERMKAVRSFVGFTNAAGDPREPNAVRLGANSRRRSVSCPRASHPSFSNSGRPARMNAESSISTSTSAAA